MKISILTLALGTLLAGHAFAGEVTGEKATALLEALKTNGAQVRQQVEGRSVSVSGVRCGSALTGRGVFGSCEMQDNNSGKVLKISDRDERGDQRPVAALVRAMRAAGAQVVDRAGGSSIDARSIECQSVYFRGVRVSCTVKK